MSCEEFVEKLIDYRCRELALPECEAIAHHLGECASCALEYCRLDADLSGFARAVEEQPRPAVHAALRAHVAQSSRRRALWSAFTRPIPIYQAALVAAAVAVLWLLFTIARPQGSSTIVLDRYDAATIVPNDLL